MTRAQNALHLGMAAQPLGPPPPDPLPLRTSVCSASVYSSFIERALLGLSRTESGFASTSAEELGTGSRIVFYWNSADWLNGKSDATDVSTACKQSGVSCNAEHPDFREAATIPNIAGPELQELEWAQPPTGFEGSQPANPSM